MKSLSTQPHTTLCRVPVPPRAQRHPPLRHSVIRPSSFTQTLLLATLACSFLCALADAGAEPLTRAAALRIAEAYCNYTWQATAKNVLQGRDIDGVEVHTPNNAATPDTNTPPDPNLWNIGATNPGMPYKWGGFDSLETFEAGIKKGKAAGDHVIMFARWLDDEKSRAQFYESSPFTKVIASTYDISDLTLRGFLPFRYKSIRD